MTAINSNRAIRGPVTAVPVVAGKGVRLVADTENNRWVVEADETELFKNTSGASGTINLSEAAEHFERVRVLYKMNDGVCGSTEVIPNANGVWVGMSSNAFYASKVRLKGTYYILQNTTLTPREESTNVAGNTGGNFVIATETNVFTVFLVLGINRIASN